MHLNVYDVFYSHCSRQRVSAATAAIFRVMLILQYTGTDVVSRVIYRLEQFQPVNHTVHTSPTTSSNRYTTLSTHHLQPVPTGIPHCPHITYNQFQPVYHTVHTSPTTSSNRYTTPSTHHLHDTLKLTTSNVTLQTLNNFNSITSNHRPFLTCIYNNYIIVTEMIIISNCCGVTATS